MLNTRLNSKVDRGDEEENDEETTKICNNDVNLTTYLQGQHVGTKTVRLPK